jgi:adenylate cyclase
LYTLLIKKWFRDGALLGLLFWAAALPVVAQTAATLEAQARNSTDRREQMTLYYRSAEKYMASNPTKASQLAHQAYIAAVEISDNDVAAKAAFLNAEGFAKRAAYTDAKLRYNRGKESALLGKDKEFAAKCLQRMSDMARREGDSKEAALFAEQAQDLRRGSSEGGVSGVPSSSTKNTPAPSRSVPTTSAEMGSLREQFRLQKETLERERLQLLAEIGLLRREREGLNVGMTDLRKKEQALTEETQQARQTIAEKQERLEVISSLKSESDRVAARKQKLVEALTNEAQLDSIAYAQELQEQELKIQRTKNFRNILLLCLLFAISIMILVYRRFLDNQKQKKILETKNRIIEDEQNRSDELLRNILPEAIATELKNEGFAKARKYETATVLFTDFKSFTQISEQLTPEQLVSELDTYFKAFDFIISQYKIEKIKTIGDAYMCASGLSDRIGSPLNMVKAALEIQEFLNEMKLEKMAQNAPYFEARIGIHTGPVVAGVVGVKKFAYDIWGDTVNTAARMQEACEPGKINISEATHAEVRYNYQCRSRGKLPAKNKGNIEMFYVEGVLK